MTNFDKLAKADFQNQWLCVTENGELDVVKKDNRFVRAFKTVIGTIFRHDFYKNIHIDQLAPKILDLAKNEKNTTNLVCYIETVDKVRDQFYKSVGTKLWSEDQKMAYGALLDVRETLKNNLKASHPEMFFTYDERAQSYRGDLYHYPHNLSEDDKTLVQHCKAAPNAELLFLANRARDASGNRWLDCRLHLTVRVKIDPRTAKKTPLGYEIQIPAWSHHPLNSVAQTCFLSPGNAPLQKDLLGLINIVVFDLKADIQPDGSCRLPNGEAFPVSSLIRDKDRIFLSETVPVNLQVQ